MTNTAEKIAEAPLIIEHEPQVPIIAPQQQFSDLMLNSELLAQAAKMAEWMASAKVTVPKHLQNNVGDCYAIVLQALQWRMNPFVVAQKTHLVSGTLGYEAQLVNAVLESLGAIRGRFHYEHRGEGAMLETRVAAIPAGETDLVWNEWLKSSDITTRNSPLWKTNPKQQMGYLQVKNWARAYKPAALLGVYTVDELMDSPAPKEKDISPRTYASQSAAESIERPPITDAIQQAIIDLAHIATTKGDKPFQDAWKALSVDEKAAIGIPKRDELRTMAKKFEQRSDTSKDDFLTGFGEESSVDAEIIE